ncbi:MAG: hypothetical protein ACTSQE_02660 [Candidatus Heimdallarchaeaceae archaeon]
MDNFVLVLIVVGCAITFVLVLLLIIFLKNRKKSTNPTILRASDVIIKINQFLYSLNNKISKIDSEITELMLVQEKQDPSLSPSVKSLDELSTLIKSKKEKIDSYIATMDDLKQYRANIKELMKSNNSESLTELESLLDQVKEKIRFSLL